MHIRNKKYIQRWLETTSKARLTSLLKFDIVRFQLMKFDVISFIKVNKYQYFYFNFYYFIIVSVIDSCKLWKNYCKGGTCESRGNKGITCKCPRGYRFDSLTRQCLGEILCSITMVIG